MQRVSQLPLQLDDSHQAELARQYQTVEDFVKGRPRTQLRAGHAADAGQEQAQEALLEYVRCNVAPAVHTGASLLAALRNTRLLPTGCESLDKGPLRGGLREGHHTEVAGESGSGKTQMCMQMAAQTTLRRERVIYIDTDGSFSGKRFAAMHERLAGGAPEADLVAALRCVDLFRVHDLHGMLQLLSALHTKLEGDQAQQRTSLLVIDSLSFLVAPMLSSAEVNGHALMICLGRAIKQLAQRFSLVALTTNHLVGGYEDMRPALGESWKAQANLRLVLTCKGPMLRRAMLAASSIAPCGASVVFDLSVRGLVSNGAAAIGQ